MRSCTFCDEIEEKLRDLVLAHRVVPVEDGGTAAGLPDGTRPPVLAEGGHHHSGERSIREFLRELEGEVVLGRQFQSDACYLDPERPGECL